MSTDLVTLTPENPLTVLRRKDGTWSAREVQGSDHVHSTWQSWEAAMDRGKELVLHYFGGVSAVQTHFSSTTKMVSIGSGAQRSVSDIALTSLGLFASCQQSRLPDLDLWFVFAGMQAAGYSSIRKVRPEPPKVGATGMTQRQLTAFARSIEILAPKAQYLIARTAMQRPPTEPPIIARETPTIPSPPAPVLPPPILRQTPIKPPLPAGSETLEADPLPGFRCKGD